MKWIELATAKKDPPFNTDMIIWFPDVDWRQVKLASVTTLENGKVFLFTDEEGNNFHNATHYCIPEPPKEKES